MPAILGSVALATGVIVMLVVIIHLFPEKKYPSHGPYGKNLFSVQKMH
jgi:hypothetical protein